ncbi:MAG TPA: hypothetical protein VF576_08885 [Rubricoccaceae bacterium]|jgi:hypothetical protein
MTVVAIFRYVPALLGPLPISTLDIDALHRTLAAEQRVTARLAAVRYENGRGIRGCEEVREVLRATRSLRQRPC